MAAVTTRQLFVKQHSSFGAKVFYLIFLIVFFEGAFGKWVSPPITTALIALRDVLCVYFIYWALFKGGGLSFPRLAQFFLACSVLVVFWGGVQLIFNQTPPILLGLGIRYWLLYQWVGVLAACVLTRDETVKMAKMALFFMMLSTPLVILQNIMPPGSFINNQVGTDEDKIFLVVTGVVRTTGTFSFTTGFALFLSLCFPLAISNRIFGKAIFENRKTQVFIILCLIASSIVSGSRTAIISLILYSSIYVGINILTARKFSYKNILQMFLISFLVVGVLYFFSSAISAILDRFATASETEDLSKRLFATVFGEPDLISTYTFLGQTIGSGSNAASVFLVGQRQFLLGETEAAKVLAEAGILGFFWILLKISFLAWGGATGLRRSSKDHDYSFIIYWVVCAVALLTWPIIGQVTVNSLGAFVLFFSLSSLKRIER